MPYIGNFPAESYSQVSYQDLTGGSGTSFTLDYPVGSAGEIEVFINNVRQEPTVAYTVSGTALTMTGSVAATDDFYVVFQGKAEKSGTIPEKQTDGTYVFPNNVTVDGNITSTGIDDNATSTAMTLDSSGNLLVGRTTSGTLTVAGSEFQAGGAGFHVRDNGTPLYVGRKTLDGYLVEFSKDGAPVGVIGTQGGDVQLGTGVVGIRFKDVENAIQPQDLTTSSGRDAATDLGTSTARFKNLYLSGGVVLDDNPTAVTGNVSSKTLDDYEEGTWTPDVSGTTTSSQSGYYTKVGSLVTAQFRLSIAATSDTANAVLSGLPFTPSGNTDAGRSMGFLSYNPSGIDMTLLLNSGTTGVGWRSVSNGANQGRDDISGNTYWGTLIYRTAQ